MAAPQLTTYFKPFKTDALGQISVTGIVNVEAFEKVNLEIIQWPAAPVKMLATCYMGKLSGETLAQVVAHLPVGTAGQIQTFDVIGPEFSVVLTGGAPNVSVPIQAWVFLH